MRRVILETPYAGDTAANLEFAHACIADCIKRNDSPFASHVLFTKALDDTDSKQRRLGIRAGFVWRSVAEVTVVYVDLGISRGMLMGIEHAVEVGQPVEYRRLDGKAP